MKSNPLASNNITHPNLVSPALASTDSGASNLDSSTEASFNRKQAQATLDYYNENATTFCQNTVNADMSAHYERFLRYFLKTNNMPLSPLALKNSQENPCSLARGACSEAPQETLFIKKTLSSLSTQSKLRLLDFGCGSGRDSLFFKSLGFAVTPVDGSVAMAQATHELTGLEVICSDFLSFSPQAHSFEAIWACASLLHLDYPSLKIVLARLLNSLVLGGAMYVSFKYGSGTAVRNGRLFTNLDEVGLTSLITLINNSVSSNVLNSKSVPISKQTTSNDNSNDNSNKNTNEDAFKKARIVEMWTTGDVRADHQGEQWLNAIITTSDKDNDEA